MQMFITWWCGLIGISDPAAIQAATGFAAVAALFVVGGLALALLAGFAAGGRNG